MYGSENHIKPRIDFSIEKNPNRTLEFKGSTRDRNDDIEIKLYYFNQITKYLRPDNCT